MLDDVAVTDDPKHCGSQELAGPEARFDRGLLFEAIVCDVHWTALQIGTLAILLNARIEARTDWTLRPWRHLLQDSGRIAQLGLMYGSDLGICRITAHKCSQLYATVSSAKVRLAPVMQDVKKYPPAVTRLIEPLASTWRQLSQKAIDVLVSLEPATRAQLNERYVENGKILSRFLQEAASGNTQSVNSFGEIALPSLAQRRRTPRIAVQEACHVLVQGRSIPATLQNVSRDGLGILCVHPLEVEHQIEVVLGNKRLLNAVVVWQNGQRAGLRLVTPLDGYDPLLRAPNATMTVKP